MGAAEHLEYFASAHPLVPAGDDQWLSAYLLDKPGHGEHADRPYRHQKSSGSRLR
jgi:hypothetical protein